MEWAWTYYGKSLDAIILDRPEELEINWNEEDEAKAADN